MRELTPFYCYHLCIVVALTSSLGFSTDARLTDGAAAAAAAVAEEDRPRRPARSESEEETREASGSRSCTPVDARDEGAKAAKG